MASGKILKDQVTSPQDDSNKPFKSFAWSQPISLLGKLIDDLQIQIYDHSNL